MTEDQGKVREFYFWKSVGTLLFVVCIVTIYHKSLLHVGSKFTLKTLAIFAVLNSILLEIPKFTFVRNTH